MQIKTAKSQYGICIFIIAAYFIQGQLQECTHLASLMLHVVM